MSPRGTVDLRWDADIDLVWNLSIEAAAFTPSELNQAIDDTSAATVMHRTQESGPEVFVPCESSPAVCGDGRMWLRVCHRLPFSDASPLVAALTLEAALQVQRLSRALIAAAGDPNDIVGRPPVIGYGRRAVLLRPAGPEENAATWWGWYDSQPMAEFSLYDFTYEQHVRLCGDAKLHARRGETPFNRTFDVALSDLDDAIAKLRAEMDAVKSKTKKRNESPFRETKNGPSS